MTAAAVRRGDVVLEVNGWVRVDDVDRTFGHETVLLDFEAGCRYAHPCAPILVRRPDDVAPDAILAPGGRWANR